MKFNPKPVWNKIIKHLQKSIILSENATKHAMEGLKLVNTLDRENIIKDAKVKTGKKGRKKSAK